MGRLFVVALLLALSIPPAVFLISAFSAGVAPADALSFVVDQYTTRKQNLLVIGLFGIIPVLFLLLASWLYRRAGGSMANRNDMAWAGLFAIALVLIWVNFEYWPRFLPARVYPGFPHGLEFFIGPVMFAPAAMLVVMVAVWGVNKVRGASAGDSS